MALINAARTPAQETERLPESRKLELNTYLKKPTARLARYPLLLESIRKHTPDRHPDKVLLVELINIIRGLLKRVSEESRKTERRLMLRQLDEQLVFSDVERVVRAEPNCFEDEQN